MTKLLLMGLTLPWRCWWAVVVCSCSTEQRLSTKTVACLLDRYPLSCRPIPFPHCTPDPFPCTDRGWNFRRIYFPEPNYSVNFAVKHLGIDCWTRKTAFERLCKLIMPRKLLITVEHPEIFIKLLSFFFF